MAKNMFTGAGAEQASAAPVVPLGPKVLVARKALPIGTIIDAESLAFVDGTEIDFVKQGLNEQFLFRNPNATAECGCGESFTTKADAA